MSFFEWLTTIDHTVLAGCCLAIGGIIAFIAVWLYPRLNSKTIARANMGGSYDTESMEKLLSNESGEKSGSKPEEKDK